MGAEPPQSVEGENMAIEVVIGRVASLKVAPEYGFVDIRIETPTGFFVPPVPPGPSNELLIMFGVQSYSGRDLFTNELSRALASGLRVRVSHEEDSAYITEVVVEAPFEGSLV
jgi:hypothetical protein